MHILEFSFNRIIFLKKQPPATYAQLSLLNNINNQILYTH